MDKPEKARPVMVLVLDEKKLPRLVARLAAPRPKRPTVPRKDGDKLARAEGTTVAGPRGRSRTTTRGLASRLESKAEEAEKKVKEWLK